MPRIAGGIFLNCLKSMAYTLGKQMAQERAKQNLSVEDVAHRTRIPGSIVKYLENDDYSHFPNLVYAKSFLKMYSKYLDVDASEFLAELNEASTARTDTPFLQAQATRDELAALSRNRMNLDFIPWQKIISILFFIGVSVPAGFFIAKLYKENKAKIEEAISNGKAAVAAAGADEIAPQTPKNADASDIEATPAPDLNPSTLYSLPSTNPPADETPVPKATLPAVSADNINAQDATTAVDIDPVEEGTSQPVVSTPSGDED